VNYVFSVRPSYNHATTSNLLAPYWDSGDEADYDDGADNTATLPAATEITARQEAIDAYRTNPKFDNIYRRFRFAPTWNNSVTRFLTSGFDEFSDVFVNPNDSSEEVPYDLRYTRFLNRLPLIRGLDYTTSAPTVPDYVSPDDYLLPFVTIELPFSSSTGDNWDEGRYALGHELHKLNEHERYSLTTSVDDSAEYNISFQLKPSVAEYAAIDLIVSGGDRYENGFTNSNRKIFFTVAMEGQEYAEGIAESDDAGDADYIREKVIYQDPELYRLDVMLKGTIFDSMKTYFFLIKYVQ
jgi:hypothetical protein